MRHYAFHFAIVVLTFGVGSFAAIKFYQNNSSNNEINKTPNKVVPVQPNNFGKNSKTVFGCNDEFIIPVLKELAQANDGISNYLQNHQKLSCQEIFDLVKTVDLNNDGFDEVIIQGKEPVFCGSAGDCPTWIVSRNKDGYKIIFDSFTAQADESFRGLEILSAKNNNLNNLKSILNNGV